MKKLLQYISISICSLLLCFAMAPDAVSASNQNAVAIGIELQYGQTEARDMLQLVNAFRADQEEAWAWAKDGTKKYFNNLSPLQYDYELEKIAMLRAAEVALSHSHTRPNGTSCFTLLQSYPGMAWGENIAAGYATGASVFEGWQEKNDDYTGQGHRRSMLSPSFNAIGIGHVYYNGTHYWTQEFAKTNSPSTAATPANDSKETVSIEILPSNMSNPALTCSTPKLNLKAGETAPLPEISMTAYISGHFPNSECPFIPQENASKASPKWTSSNSAVAIVTEDGAIQALTKGTSTLSVSWNNLTASCKVTVQASSNSTDAQDNSNTANGAQQNNNNNGSSDNPKPDDTDPDIVVPKTNLINAKNSGAGKMKIKWTKNTSADGYQIMYSTVKDFSSSQTKLAGSQSSSKTITGLKKGKTYYVKIRAYTQQNGTTYYGGWSKTKKVKIKK